MNKIPLYVSLLAKLIPVLKTEGNLAEGEIEKFNFVESQKNTTKFNKQIIGCKGGYDYIWKHISDDWFKIIGKWPESHC